MNFRKVICSFLIVLVSFVYVDCKKDINIAENVIALTFDDGPDYKYTPQVLDILREKNVKATFFLIGRNIKKHPNIAKRIFKDGHGIGNHTYNHLNILTADFNLITWEITMTENLIDSLFGKRPKFVRPPWGLISDSQINELTNLGYKVVKWDIDSFDWDVNHNTVEEIVNRVISQSRPGKIVLFHCADYLDIYSREKTIEALPLIIEKLQQRNYNFVKLEELNKFK